MFNSVLILFFIIIFSAFLFFWVVKKSRNLSTPPLPPGPRGLPLVGYLPFLGTELHKTFTELATVYGPIYKLRLGNKLCVVISSPSLVKEVVRDQDATFANRDPPIAALVLTYGAADVAFSNNGPYWRNMRKIFVREMLSNKNLDACYDLRRQEVQKTLKIMYNKIGKPIDLGELTFFTAVNAVISMLVGRQGEGEEEEEQRTQISGVNSGEIRKVVADMMVILGKPNISDFYSILAWFDLQGIEREAKKILDCVERIIDSIIEQRIKEDLTAGKGEKSTRKDFLQLLLELKEREDSATSITLTQLKALLIDIVIGGTDTTATMVEWVITELMRHPEIMRKVNEELTEVVGLNNTVEEFHLSKLQYLDAVIKETLRLHPALPFLVPHCPSQSTVVGGYTIPKGTSVFLNVWAIHRDHLIWDNPLEFKPERFLNDSCKVDYAGNNFQFFPFGSGRRVCAGLSLAEKMLPFILASFLHSFEWKLPEGVVLDLSDKFGLVTKKKTSLVAIPTPKLV